MSTPEEVVDRAKGGKGPSASKLLGREIKTWWILLMRPIEDYLIDKKVHPNVLTVTSLIVSAIAGFLFYKGWIFFAGIILLTGSNFDMLDGRIARAEGLGVDCEVGIMQRTERIVYLGAFSVFNLFGNLATSAFGYKPGDYLLKFALALILIFSSYTAIERMIHVMKRLKEREGKKRE